MASSPPTLSRAAVLEGFAAAAQAGGLDPLALLARHGIPVAALGEPELRISARAVLLMLEDAARDAAMPDFGLTMAEARGFSTLGAVGLAMREQRDVRSALAWLMSRGWIQTESLVLELEETDELALLTLDVAPGMPLPAVQSLELAMAAIVRLLRHLLGADWQAEMVLFSHACPALLAAHLKHFGQVPQFGADRNALVLRRSDLDRPISGADPELARELERLLSRTSGERRISHSNRVQGLIRQALLRGSCRVDRVAAAMGIDRRTLHRRLATEGSSYTALLDQVRRERVSAYLAQGGLSLTEIAERVDFSSLSAFSRWRRADPKG